MAEAEVVDNSRQTGQNSQRSAEEAQRRARIRELEAEIERYRQASEDALQQLDWCIGYYAWLGEERNSEITFKESCLHPHTPVKAR